MKDKGENSAVITWKKTLLTPAEPCMFTVTTVKRILWHGRLHVQLWQVLNSVAPEGLRKKVESGK